MSRGVVADMARSSGSVQDYMSRMVIMEQRPVNDSRDRVQNNSEALTSIIASEISVTMNTHRILGCLLSIGTADSDKGSTRFSKLPQQVFQVRKYRQA